MARICLVAHKLIVVLHRKYSHALTSHAHGEKQKPKIAGKEISPLHETWLRVPNQHDLPEFDHGPLDAFLVHSLHDVDFRNTPEAINDYQICAPQCTEPEYHLPGQHTRLLNAMNSHK